MRLEELKSEQLEIPEFIHNMIQEEVGKQVEKSDRVSNQKKHKFKWNMGRVAAGVVVGITVTSTVVCAGAKLYHMHLEKHQKYSVEIGIQPDQEDNSLELPDQIHDISINSTYIPEGMQWIEKGYKSTLGYKETPNEGGISIFSVLMDRNNLDKVLQDKNVVESEEYIFGVYEGVYIRYNDLNEDKSFNQRIYVLCPEIYRILTIYIGDDVSKEDAYKFVEGMVITEKDEMIKTADMEKWSDMIARDENIEAIELPQSITNANIPIYQIGETFDLGYATGVDNEGNYVSSGRIKVCVDEVQILDDLQLLKEEFIPKEWKTAVDQNGKLVQNHLSYIRMGDGIESLDEVVGEKKVSQKLIYTTVTYTNASDKEVDDVLYLGSLMTLKKQDDGTYTVYLPEETGDEGYDYYVGDSVAEIKDMKYYDVKKDDKNHIPSLKAGESIQIHMAWVVNETDIQNLYLDLSGFGTPFEIHENVVNTGLVYIGR